MKYNVGDKVRIKSIDWYILNKDKDMDIKIKKFLKLKDIVKEG